MKLGEHKFKNIFLPEYKRNKLENWVERKTWKENLTDKSYFMSLPEVFKDFGVGLTYTPFLPKTVYGAVRWINDRPLIQISDSDKCQT